MKVCRRTEKRRDHGGMGATLEEPTTINLAETPEPAEQQLVEQQPESSQKLIPFDLSGINGLPSHEIAFPIFKKINIFATKCLNGPPKLRIKYFP